MRKAWEKRRFFACRFLGHGSGKSEYTRCSDCGSKSRSNATRASACINRTLITFACDIFRNAFWTEGHFSSRPTKSLSGCIWANRTRHSPYPKPISTSRIVSRPNCCCQFIGRSAFSQRMSDVREGLRGFIGIF